MHYQTNSAWVLNYAMAKAGHRQLTMHQLGGNDSALRHVVNLRITLPDGMDISVYTPVDGRLGSPGQIAYANLHDNLVERVELLSKEDAEKVRRRILAELDDRIPSDVDRGIAILRGP